MSKGTINVPDYPIIPYIEGDGTGLDIWQAAVHVFDIAVEKAYGDQRKIHWHEVLAGEVSLCGHGLPVLRFLHSRHEPADPGW